ncbi:MAG: HlyC/CorC family transporter [Alphaproteobacteria bacterium]|nr:HlyC/CorC family transporter [Alphaproteobacteria bacterium]
MEALVIILLAALNGVFAMSEMALVSSRRTRLEQMARDGSSGARAALRLLDEPSRFLSTVQIGITLIGIVNGAYGGATLTVSASAALRAVGVPTRIADEVAWAIVIATITYLSLIVGELVPKRAALRHPEQVAAILARPMAALSLVAAPLAWLLSATTEAALRVLGIKGGRDAAVTEEEVRSLISEGTRAGIFVPQEKALIDGVLQLADRTARSIMTPRPDIVWVDVEEGVDAVRSAIKESGYSRFLVCRGDIDNLLGIVQAKTLLEGALRGQVPTIEKCLDKPLVVHEGISVLKLLDLFKVSPLHIAVVVDEYGSVQGVATMTDIITAVAGELPQPGEKSAAEIVALEDGTLLVDGMTSIAMFEERVGMQGLRDEGDFETVAGFALWRLGRVPQTGEAFDWAGARFEVVDMDGRRIDKLRVRLPAGAQAGR